VFRSKEFETKIQKNIMFGSSHAGGGNGGKMHYPGMEAIGRDETGVSYRSINHPPLLRGWNFSTPIVLSRLEVLATAGRKNSKITLHPSSQNISRIV